MGGRMLGLGVSRVLGRRRRRRILGRVRVRVRGIVGGRAVVVAVEVAVVAVARTLVLFDEYTYSVCICSLQDCSFP